MNHNNAHCSDYIKREDAKRVLNKGLRYMRAFGVNRCLPMIYEVPSADVRENVRGEWIEKHYTINCSVCKNCLWSGPYIDLVKKFNFCPNCGADMRGDNP